MTTRIDVVETVERQRVGAAATIATRERSDRAAPGRRLIYRCGSTGSCSQHSRPPPV